MNEKELQKIITELWKIVSRLENNYKKDDRKFTIDGHLLGSIGEVYAKEKFKLKLLPKIDRNTKRQDNNTQQNKVSFTK